MELRATIADDYKNFLQSNPRRRKARYESLDHDARIWLVAKDHQIPSRRGTLFSGSFVLTSDISFWRFDRQILRKQYASKPVVVLPDALLQALRPFVGTSSPFDNAAFAKLFSAAEFRGADTESYSVTVQRVAGYLASFSDLTEETARRILTDSMLMRRIGQADESSDAFQDPIRDAIVEHNELLIRERDELREERLGDLELARQAVRRVASDTSVGEDIKAVLVQLVERLESEQPTIGTVVIGSMFQNRDTEVVAQGANAAVYDSTITQQLLSVDVSDPALLAELSRIREALLNNARTGADYETIAGIQSAIEAAEQGDERSVVKFLKKAGAKALEVGLDIGTKIAVKALESAGGMSS